MNVLLQPETDPRVLDEFAVSGERAIGALLNELHSSRVDVALYPGQRTDRWILSRLERVDPEGIEIQGSQDAGLMKELLSSQRLLAVACQRTIKLQFHLDGLRASGTPQAPSLIARPPELMHRIQRRSAYRLSTRHCGLVQIVLRTDEWPSAEAPPPEDAEDAADSPAIEFTCPVADLSVDGVAFALPEQLPIPAIGTVVRHARLESQHWAPIPCDMRIERIVPAQHGRPCRVGCTFFRMDGQFARMLARELIGLERGQRF